MVELSRNSFTTSIVFKWFLDTTNLRAAQPILDVNFARLSQAAFVCNCCGTDSERPFVTTMYVLPFSWATTISTVPKPGAQWGKPTQRAHGGFSLDGLMENLLPLVGG